MGVNWANLPEELLLDIAIRFKFVEDLAIFSCVCTSWNSVSCIAKAKLKPSLPWLMLPDNVVNNTPGKWDVHNIDTKKTYAMDLPETRGRDCWGCADGWIFTVGHDMDIELFNLLTKSRISLPSALTLPLNPLTKSRISLTQTDPGNELRVFVRHSTCFWAFAIAGDLVWNVFQCHDTEYPDRPYFIECVIGFKGEVLVLYEHVKLASLIKLDGSVAGQSTPHLITEGEVDIIADVFVPGAIGGYATVFGLECHNDQVKRLHLLDSFGDLLVVVEVMTEGWDNVYFGEEPATLCFEVFKLDSAGKKWVKLDDIGDAALFICDRSSMAVRATSGDNCKPNCIYFIEDMIEPVDFREYTVGVFHLSTGVIKEIYVGGDQIYEAFSPFWLMPKPV